MSKARKSKNNPKARRKDKRTQAPELARWALWATAAVAALGVLLALYATSTTIQIEKVGVVEASGCSINDVINCDVAHGSSYALFLGIPVAWWGFLFYLWALVSAVFALYTSNKNSAAAGLASAWVLSLGAVLFSVYKAFNLYQLGVVCLVCIGMYGVNIALALLIPLAFGLSMGEMGAFLGNYLKGILGQESGLSFSPNPKVFILVGALFGLGFVGMKNYTDNNIQRVDVDVDQVMRAHYRQPAREIDIAPSAVAWGNPDAPITVVEFGDFQCPGCRDAAFHLRPALFEFHDDVRLYYLNFPLDNTINEDMSRQVHPAAGVAAKASVCAAENGDFWEYHDDIFRNQSRLTRNLLVSLAEERGWDPNAFNACLNDPETTARVKRDLAAGKEAGVASTPTVYINGRRIAGGTWRSNEVIRAIIREEMDRTR